MIIFYYLITILSGAITVLPFILLKNKINNKEKAFKILSYILIGIFFVRYMGGECLLRNTFGLNIRSPFGDNGIFKTEISMLIYWFVITSCVLLQTFPFYNKDVKTLSVLVKFVLPVIYLISIIILPISLVAMDGQAVLEKIHFRSVVYSVEIGFSIGYIVNYWFYDKNLKYSKKEFLYSGITLIGMLLASIPYFTLQVFFGDAPTDAVLDKLNLEHRIAVYGAVLMPFVLFFVFRKFSYRQKRYAMLYFAVAMMIGYSNGYTFKTFLDVGSWPLHLCNTAMYIVPICLIFKLDKVFYFTLFINVFGALLAMLMPSTTGNIFSRGVVGFWFNHYMAFYMPILVLSLKIYERPKLKQFTYSLIAFAVYYAIVLVVNAYLSGKGDRVVDFFFINSDFVSSKLGTWAENLRKAKLEFNFIDSHIVLYPVYQSLYFIVYIALSLAMWFIYEQFFEIVDVYGEIAKRNEKIKIDKLALQAKLDGRSEEEPMELESVNKLILRDFSKKYATSDVYAVKNANLEIEGGQIFGFLGPNGAGKSTIIKSIVGIQTITSGSILVNGYDVEKQSVMAKRQIGFVPDHYALYENLTGREYVNYIADLYEVPEKERNERIDEYVKRFYLQGSFENQMKTYSHGMKQKITIMSALVHNPKLWILDEPLTGLDPESIFQVKECMKEHAKKGNIVFFSSHIIDVVERICDKIAIIKKGDIKCVKTLEEIENSGVKLEDFYMETIGEVKHD